MLALFAWMVVMFERWEAVTSAQFEIEVRASRMASRIPALRLHTLVKDCASAVGCPLISRLVVVMTIKVAITIMLVRCRERLGARPWFGFASPLGILRWIFAEREHAPQRLLLGC